MSVTVQLPPEVESVGLLTGLLTENGGGTTFQPGWFENPLAAAPTPSLANAHHRLGALVELLESSLSPATGAPPPVFPGAAWYAIPDPSTNAPSPFCVVAPAGAPGAGELGLGALYTTTSGDVTFEVFAYLPLVDYSTDGASLVATSAQHPMQIGVRALDSKGFTVDAGQPDAVTFDAMDVTGYLYLNSTAYESKPLPKFFELKFENLAGTNQPDTYDTLAALLDANVDAWIAEVVLQASTWLGTFIGDAPVTIRDILVQAGFLTGDGKGAYHLSISALKGQSAEDIVLAFVFGALQSLSDSDAPYAAIELPKGGLYFTDRFNADGTIDYGMRLVLDVPLVESVTAGSPSVDLSLGSWLTGEQGDSGWIHRSLGTTVKDVPDPGVSVYLLREGPSPSDVGFAPGFALSSVGVNVKGGANAPLFTVEGVTLGGFEARVYLDEHADWKLGAAARLDDLGVPLGPKLTAPPAGSNSNPVAQNLLASGSPSSSSTGGDPQPVNPTFSMSAAWVEGGTFAFQLYDQSGGPAPEVMLPVQRSLGPLSVQRLGVGWVEAQDELSLLVDGGVVVGQLNVELVGLTVGIPVTTPGDLSKYDLDLEGLGITFQAGEIDLSGAFVKLPPEPPRTYTEYDGEVVLSAGAFTIAALGSYAHVGNGDGYTSLFIFGVLDADLGGPPFFYVTGVAAGFGYNRGLILPAQDAVTTFPLVEAASDPATIGAKKNPGGGWQMPSPATALSHIDRFVPPERGEYWLSAGVRFTSFDLIHSTALLVVEFGNELEIALLGLSSIALPPAAGPGERYAYAELGIEIKLLPAEGEFSATAILTPNSFVLDPACKLTGGFAFYVWFGDNPHAGEFVLTLGGYHPDFHPPSYYPAVPRLGFDWPMGGGVEVSGDAYFALTPSAVMAGGALQVLFSSGDLHAWLTAHMDALIEWAPLHYELDIGVSIGVSFKLNLLFVSVTLKVELSADLTIWGPPTGGRVHIDWYVISFTVGFGAGSEGAPPPLPWTNDAGTGFAQTLLPHSVPAQQQAQQPSPAAALAAGAQPDPAPQPAGVYTIALTSGLVTTFQNGAATVWVVSPTELAFSVATQMPATEIDLMGPNDTVATTIAAPSPDPDGQAYYVGIRPMKAMVQASKLQVTVTDDEHGDAVVPIATDFDYRPAFTRVPAAKWGEPLAAGKDPEMNTLLPGRLMGLDGIAPKQPTLSPIGVDALAMVVETTFTYEVVDDEAPYTPEHLPLSPAAEPPATPPVLDPDAFETIGDTLMAGGVVTARGEVLAALRQYGVDPGTDGPLELLAGQPGAYLTGNPLMEKAAA
ncbi:MAG TPA: DUF6603 domain-containing protein [Thermoleophilaceae bacterium]|jgi:hypothetical protein